MNRKSSLPGSTGRRPSTSTVLSVLVVVLFAAVVAVMVATSKPAEEPAAAPPLNPADAAATAARPDSHRLSAAPGSPVVLAEFLDFECEACGARYPVIEQLRERYAGRVEFVMRYFPLPGHFNAERAARAVEASARQGRLEAMYKMMFETQREWGEQREPLDDRFRGYAERIGLDMARFDADYNDPGTLARIMADMADGERLGVTGTPSFFLNGKETEARSLEEFRTALDSALAGK